MGVCAEHMFRICCFATVVTKLLNSFSSILLSICPSVCLSVCLPAALNVFLYDRHFKRERKPHLEKKKRRLFSRTLILSLHFWSPAQ